MLYVQINIPELLTEISFCHMIAKSTNYINTADAESWRYSCR